MSEDQLNNNLNLVSGRESLELIKTVGTGEFLGQEKKLVSRGSKKNNEIKMLICLGHTHQHKARAVTRSFDVCLNSNIDDTNTMAMEGNKDVVFPRTSVMNAPAVCSIDFNPKLQIESQMRRLSFSWPEMITWFF